MNKIEPIEAQIKEACEVLDKSRYSVEVAIVSSLFAQRDAERAEHEAFREQVSEVAGEWLDAWERGKLASLATRDKTCPLVIQPDPEPTPAEVLMASLTDAGLSLSNLEMSAALEALTMRGIELRFKDRSHEG